MSASIFRDDAAALCDFIDAMRGGTVSEKYTNLLQLLSNLAKSAAALPFELANQKAVASDRIDHLQWKRIASEIGDAIGPALTELMAEHSEDEAERDRAFSLWDDLADIYRDLRHGLDLYAVGDPDHISEAVWQWKFGYENHWGSHLMRALKTVHEIRYCLRME